MDRLDDFAAVDSLEVDAGDPQIAMLELPLDNHQRDALVGELDSVSMPQLVLVPTSAQAPLSRHARYADVNEQVLAGWAIVASRSA